MTNGPFTPDTVLYAAQQQYSGIDRTAQTAHVTNDWQPYIEHISDE